MKNSIAYKVLGHSMIWGCILLSLIFSIKENQTIFLWQNFLTYSIVGVFLGTVLIGIGDIVHALREPTVEQKYNFSGTGEEVE